MLLIWMSACWWNPPTQTGRNGMSGQILDFQGDPISGAQVYNLESSVETDEDGRFGLYYKPPDTNVYFVLDGVKFWRNYRDEDEGQVVRIQLPVTSALDLDCGDLTCRLDLKWDLGDGLLAKVSQACAADRHTVWGVPGVPEASCRAGSGIVADAVRRDGDTLVLLGTERDVTVELDADGDPQSCAVTLAEARADFVDGRATLPVRGEGWAQVVCDGRPAFPVHIGSDADTVTAPWSAMGPSFQAPAGVELAHLELSRVDAPWTLRAEPGTGGAFLLPPLSAGTYRIVLYEGTPVEVPPDLEPDSPQALTGRLLPSGAFVVALAVAQDVVDGVLEPSLKESP